MKLNPRLLNALATVARTAKNRLQFQFFPLAARGITHLHLSSVVTKLLPNAIVYPELPYDAYLSRLAVCDFFVSPFPYGNMNSIVDAAALGLPGVCLDGAEAHAHADAAMFARMGFPPELSAQNVDDYIAAVVTLADDALWRAKCRRIAASCDLNTAFFKGRPELFCEAVAALVEPGLSGASASAPPASVS
jgi:hypothetical protein